MVIYLDTQIWQQAQKPNRSQSKKQRIPKSNGSRGKKKEQNEAGNELRVESESEANVVTENDQE